MHEFKRRFPPPPLDWSRHRLVDITDRVTARNVDRNQNVLTISAEFGLISQSEFFSRRVASESVTGYFLLENGDFAYNKSYSRGYPLGAIRRLDRYEKGCVSPLYICFRPRPEAVDSNFLLQYLDGGAIDAGLADVAKEGVRNHGLLNVGVADFFGLEVPLPPVAEQRMAAQILDTLDTTIRQTEAIIEKLKQVKQGLLHDLLTCGINAHGEPRPLPSQAPHLYKDSPLGWIPREWEVLSVDQISESIVDGPFGSNLKTEHYVPLPGVRVVRLQNIGIGDYDDNERAYVSELKASALSRNQVSGGDVLVAALGDERYPVGRACCYPVSLPPAVNKADCFRLRPRKEFATGPFVMRNLNGAAARRQIRGFEQGVTMQRVNLGNLRRVMLSMPSVTEQQLMCERVDALDMTLAANVAEVSKLREQKSGLMDDLLTGRVRVTPLLA